MEQDLVNCNGINDNVLEPEVGMGEPPAKKRIKGPLYNKPVRLPLAKIRQIMKLDPEVTMAGLDAVFLIAKATELFIEALSKDSYSSLARTKKKTILGKHVDEAIANSDALAFLDGAMQL